MSNVQYVNTLLIFMVVFLCKFLLLWTESVKHQTFFRKQTETLWESFQQNVRILFIKKTQWLTLYFYITDHSPIHQKLLFYCLFKLLTLLMYLMSDNKMAVGGGSGHKSFLHHDTYSGLWRRDLVLNSSNSSITNNSSSVSSSGVRLTSVRHKREDSDDIRSDTSSDNLIDDNDDSDSNNPGPVEIRFYIIWKLHSIVVK